MELGIEMLAKYLKSKYLKTKHQQVESSNKKVQVMGCLMCLHGFYSTDGEIGDALTVIENLENKKKEAIINSRKTSRPKKEML